MPSFDPERFCWIVEKRGVEMAMLVPSMLHALVRSGAARRHRMTRLRTLMTTGAAAPPQLLLQVHELLPHVTISNTYTSTEAWPAGTTARFDPSDPESGLGQPSPGSEITVLAPDGSPAPVGETGEIALRTAGATARRYAGAPAAQPGGPEPGWHRTGDAGYVDDRGRVRLVDRMDDVVNVGGSKVSTVEVEGQLLDCPDVVDAAVFGLPHQSLGTCLVAAVVPANGTGPAALRRWLLGRLSAHKVPLSFILVPELPRGPSGKVGKRWLREACASIDVSRDVAPPPATVDRLAAAFSAALGGPRVGPFDSFFSAGGDSLSAMRLVTALRDQLGADVGLDQLYEHPTPVALAHLLAAAPSGR
jgi:acyl-coenzyme A synthetase/AMP-(fatty) acid ligase/aryl carrier-like protein